MNRLYYGDNLTIMRDMPSQCVDLIYLDPPFKSDKNYNLLYRNLTGRPVPELADAFCDTWEMDPEKEQSARQMPVLMREHGVDDYYVEFWRLWMQALRYTQPHLLAYLIYMVERLLQMKVVLKPHGSIYLHCDPTASHYIKIMMDGIFGHRNFRNEVIWKRTSSHNNARKWAPVHDVLLFYTRSDRFTWNRMYQAYDEDYIKRNYPHKDSKGRKHSRPDLFGSGTRKGESGQPWRGVDPTSRGRHWAVPPRRSIPDWVDIPEGYDDLSVQERLDFLDECRLIHWPEKGEVPRFRRYLDVAQGNPVRDIISDIPPVSSNSPEDLGYDTQKPVPLLDRIIGSSSKPGDVVFDPFCGCGTAIYSAESLGRQWIGCDIAILAVRLVADTLDRRYGLRDGRHYDVSGVPVSYEQALDLFQRDPFQFQHWAVEKVGGFPTKRKTGDQGIDGRIYFDDKDGLKSMVLSVKGGHVKPMDIRELRGVVERDEALMAGYISNREPTKAMRREAAMAGMIQIGDERYPHIQTLTTKEMMAGRKFDTPTRITSRVKKGQGSFKW